VLTEIFKTVPSQKIITGLYPSLYITKKRGIIKGKEKKKLHLTDAKFKIKDHKGGKNYTSFLQKVLMTQLQYYSVKYSAT